MDEEQQLPEPKISEVEIVIIGLFYLILDLIDLIPIAGDITDIIAAPMGFYYWIKGINGITFIVAEILDFIPFVQEIPSRTIGWGVTVYLDRHPKLEAKLGTAIAVAGVLEGDVEGAEGTTAEAEGAAAGASAGRGTTGGGTAVGTGEAREVEGGVKSGGEQSEQNAKPSEKSTERGGEEEQKGKRSESGNRAEEGGEESESTEEAGEEETPESQESSMGTQAEKSQREKDEEYEKMMEPEAERPWEEGAKKEYFEYQDPAQQKKIPPKVEDIESAKARIQAKRRGNAVPGETEDQRKLRERYEGMQEKMKSPEDILDEGANDETDHQLPKAA